MEPIEFGKSDSDYNGYSTTKMWEIVGEERSTRVSFGRSGRTDQKVFTCCTSTGGCSVNITIWQGCEQFDALHELMKKGEREKTEKLIWSLVFEHRWEEMLSWIFNSGVKQGNELKSRAILKELGL